MGNLAKLLAIATLIAAMFMLSSQQKTALETGQNQSEDQQALLARQTAGSGLRMALSKAKQDFDGWRVGYDQAALDGGNFDVAVQGPAAGPIRVVAMGSFGKAQHQVQATLARLAPTPAAVLIDADTVEATLSNDFLISGRDTRPGSAARVRRVEGKGHGRYANGVWTRSSEGHSAFVGAAYGDKAVRVRGTFEQSDIVQGVPEDIDAFSVPLGLLYGEAVSRADETFPDGTVFDNVTFGAPGYPQLIVVEGSAVATGTTRGYGLLIVKGSFYMHDDFEWEGIVLAHRQEGDMDVTLTGHARIYGALIGRHGFITGSGDGGDSGDEGGDGGDGCHDDGDDDGDDDDDGGDDDDDGSAGCGSSGGDDDDDDGDGDDDDGDADDDDGDGDDDDGDADDDDDDGDTDDDGDADDDDDGGAGCGSSDDDDDDGDGDDDDSDGDDDDDEGSAGDCGEGGDDDDDEGTETVGSAGKLRFAMRNNAAVYYSTEAIGKLATRLPVVKNASWIVKFDQVGEDL